MNYFFNAKSQQLIMRQVRAQVSFEFLVVLFFALLLFLFSLFVFNEKNSGFVFSREQFEAKLVAGKIAREINSVFLAGNGANSVFFLEKNFEYSVVFFENAVRVKWREFFVDAPLLSNGVVSVGIVPLQFVSVRNVNGSVLVENV